MSDFTTALKVSSSGMAASRERVNLSASNLANAETTRGPDGGPYRRLDPVFETVILDEATGAVGVRVSEVRQDQEEGKTVYMPGHPDADKNGFVRMPNVNPVNEVVNLLSAQRGYEANASAVDTVKTMAARALDIMR
jgi:flagellar basal-body rod protein FlgC